MVKAGYFHDLNQLRFQPRSSCFRSP
jgi:hypothetical protein